MTASTRVPRWVLWLGASVAVFVGLWALLVLFAWWRFGVPETVVGSTFTACEREYELEPGYLAFDYGSYPMAYVPETATLFAVRSELPGASLPQSPDEIFASWPQEVSELVVPEYGPFIEFVNGPDTVHVRNSLGHIRYTKECVALVSLNRRLPPLPRADDWAITIYESRTGEPDPQLSKWLAEIRASGVADE